MKTKAKEKVQHTRFKEIPPALKLDAVEQFVLRMMRPDDVVNWFAREHGISISRELVYKKLIPWAHEEGIFRLLLPPERSFARMLGEHFGQDPERLLIVNSSRDLLRQHIATATAALVVQLILQVWEQKDVVHIGLGGGVTVQEICRELAVVLAAQLTLPTLVFHALSSGFDVANPASAPISFMTVLDHTRIRAERRFIGLFARPFVEVENYKAVSESPGVLDSVREAKNIDIVITSCATQADKHGALSRFAEVSKGDFQEQDLIDAGWKGDLQYQPFGDDGPIPIKKGLRAFALLDFEELSAMARHEHKHVVVVAAPCGSCREAKVNAVRPLLACPELAVWNHLVTDINTADLLLPKRHRGPRPIYV